MHALLIAAALSQADMSSLGVKMPTASLNVVTMPAGAEVTAVYFRRGAEGQARCVAPCRLYIPKGAPFVLKFRLEGYRQATTPQVRWADGLAGYTLKPNTITVTLERVQIAEK